MRRSSVCLRFVGVLLSGVLAPAAPAGQTRNISSVAQLNYWVTHAGTGDELVLAARDYYLTHPLEIKTTGLTIRGATGNRDNVQLIGSGMNVSGVNEGICFSADNVTVRDLTIRDFYHNALHIRGESDADGIRISNVKTWNIGQRHVKGSGGGGEFAVSDDVIIENLYMLQTEPREDGNYHGDYIGGIDAMGVRNWVIRDCVAEGIRGHFDGGNAAIFLWHGVDGVVIERNRIFGCVKGIALGNPSAPDGDDFTRPWHAQNVLVRNNFVLRGPWTTGNNIGLELCNVKDVQVYNNTLYSEYAGYFRQFSPYDDNGGGAVTDLKVVNNIIRGHCWDNAAGDWSDTDVRDLGNIVDASGGYVLPGWFEDWASGDFHLTVLAGARDTGTVLAGVPEDFDLCGRGASPDLGGDEFQFPGDANTDGVVNVLDLGMLANHYRQTGAGWNGGDFNGDGVVNVLDLGALSNHYGWGEAGGSAGAAANQAVPEPLGLVLLALAGGAVLRRRRARGP